MKARTILPALAAALLALFLLASCAVAPAETNGEAENGVSDAEKAQNNPARTIPGLYTESQSGAVSLEITLKEDNGAIVVARWLDPSGKTFTWSMSGSFDSRKNTLAYADCIKVSAFEDEQNGTITEVLYRDGKGSFRFENGEVRWIDEEEHFADSFVFVRI